MLRVLRARISYLHLSTRLNSRSKAIPIRPMPALYTYFALGFALEQRDFGYVSESQRREGKSSTSLWLVRFSGWSLLGALATVQQQHGDDDGAVDNLATGFRDLDHRKYRLQEGDQDHAGDRAEKGAASAENAGTAEHHRRNCRKEIRVAHSLIGVSRVAGKQHSGKRRAGAGNRKAGNDHAASVDAGEIDRRLSIADGVDAAAKYCPAQQDNDEEADDGPDPQSVRNAENRSADSDEDASFAVERSCGAKPLVWTTISP